MERVSPSALYAAGCEDQGDVLPLTSAPERAADGKASPRKDSSLARTSAASSRKSGQADADSCRQTDIAALEVEQPGASFSRIVRHEGTVAITVDEAGAASRPKFSWRLLFRFFGPGLLMCIAYIDPGNLEADLQAGAQAQYKLLWVFMWSTVMGFIFQCLAARLGVATGLNLAQHARREYPRAPRILLWLMAEVAIIGADIQEVIGSAIAIQLLSDGVVPLWAGVLITGVDAFLFLYLEKLGIRKLEALFGVLLGTMCVSFGVMYIRAGIPQLQVLKGLFVPLLPKSAVSIAAGAVGAIVMPHNIYLHSALVISKEREVDRSKDANKREALFYIRFETAFALFCAFMINLFVVCIFAKGFYGQDIPDLGLLRSGIYLGQTYGEPYKYIWGLGLLASGQSSTMTGTYTGQLVMQGYWNINVNPWKRAAVVRSVAIVPTLIVAVLATSSGTIDKLNQGLNILQSIQLPYALIPVIFMTSHAHIMGAAFTNSRKLLLLTSCIAAAVLSINSYLIVSFVQENFPSAGAFVGCACLMVLYYLFLIYLVMGPRRYAALKAWAAVKIKGKRRSVAEEEEEEGERQGQQAGDAAGAAAVAGDCDEGRPQSAGEAEGGEEGGEARVPETTPSRANLMLGLENSSGAAV